MISIIATALKTNCAVETRPGSGSAFKQSLLTRSIEALDIEYIIIAETDALVSLASSGIFFESLRAATPQRDPVQLRVRVLLATQVCGALTGVKTGNKTASSRHIPWDQSIVGRSAPSFLRP